MTQATEQVEIGTGPPAEVEDDAPGQALEARGDVGSMDALMMQAMERGEDAVEVLERLIALRERVEGRATERAMAEAMAAFQEECPPIPRTAEGHHGAFAPLDEVVRVVRPIMGRHGLTFAHDGHIEESGRIRVTCTLRHVAGAVRVATFEGPPDKSGGKNPIQEMASTRSYLRRYTLIDVLGLTSEEDDDGEGAGEPPEPISAKHAADLRDHLDDVGADEAAFCRWFGVGSLEDVPRSRWYEAVQAVERKREQIAKTKGDA